MTRHGWHGAAPWRFSAGDYVIAIRNVPRTDFALQGPTIAASWDAALTEAMARHRIAVAEEAVADRLLQDLQSL